MKLKKRLAPPINLQQQKDFDPINTMNATNTKAVATLTANFRKCDYGYIACSIADSAIAESFLPETMKRNGAAVFFKEALLDSFMALAAASGVHVMLVSSEEQARKFVNADFLAPEEDTRDW